MFKLSSIVLAGDSQPDFEELKAMGWVHPLGLRDELLESSLVKSCGGLQFQITRHDFGKTYSANWPTYTEIFVHSNIDDINEPLLKGHGTSFSVADVCGALAWLAEELG